MTSFQLDTLAEPLIDMLSYRRPDKSKSERKFIRRFLTPLGVEPDGVGNLVLRIGDAPIAWCCHTDTVHRQGGRQQIYYTKTGLLCVGPKEDCLGADDTAGVWLMTEMIKANVPGLYLFHRGEECGSRGSMHIAKTTMLDGIKAAIAFDRKGYTDVITHQRGERCCSKIFADSLSSLLGDKYQPDPTGLFTDTANYTDVVGECTNISVGYHGAHGTAETLDMPFALKLRHKLITTDFTKLNFDRKPGEQDPDDYRHFGYRDWSGAYGDIIEYDWVSGKRSSNGNHYSPSNGISAAKFFSKDHMENEQRGDGEFEDYRMSSMFAMVREFPDETADFLEAMGVNADELREHIESAYHFPRR